MRNSFLKTETPTMKQKKQQPQPKITKKIIVIILPTKVLFEYLAAYSSGVSSSTLMKGPPLP